jgi:antibiotic biosynthesis monooxygenase (ABM) superfamily enzyme
MSVAVRTIKARRRVVAIGIMLAAPLMESWHPILRAFFLTLVVVPTAVYVVLPRLFRVHAFLAGRSSTRRNR